uniref:Transmembrane protein 216 n=1 Tax=Loa loa TaxID=7209 RepID=A0A1I7VKX7_LOALO
MKYFDLPFGKNVYRLRWKRCFILLSSHLKFLLARKGNLTETSGYLSFALLLNALTLTLCVYWALFQSYVLFIEFVVVCVEAFLVIIETVFAIAAVANFSRSTDI